jgi:hypothetical protein
MSYYYKLGLGFDQVWSKKQMANKFTWIVPKIGTKHGGFTWTFKCTLELDPTCFKCFFKSSSHMFK